MKRSMMTLASLLAIALRSAAEKAADPINLEVGSSHYTDDFDVNPSHQYNSIGKVGTGRTNLRGLQELQCTGNQKLVQLTLLTDKFPKDTSWALETRSGTLIDSSPSSNGPNAYEKETGYQTKYCLDVGTKYTLTFNDKWGDGLQQKSIGYYKLAVRTSSGWRILASGGDFKFKSVDTFAITSNGGKVLSSSNPATTSKPVYAPVPTPSNYAHSNSNNSKPSASKPSFQGTGAQLEQFEEGSKIQFTSRMGCPSSQRKARVEIQLDRFGDETTWKLTSSDGREFMKNSRTYGRNDYEIMEKCLPEDKYKLIVYDGSGDGICCQSGDGYYAFYLETNGKWEEIFRGGKFKAKKDINFIKIGPLYMNDRDEEWLVAHNSRREKYHTEYGKEYVPLKWSQGLKDAAALYAEELLNSCPSPTIIHDPNTSYGENLAKNRGVNGWGDLKPADNILNRFVERELDDPWPHNAHLSQVLWRATRYVGCAESVMPMTRGMCRIQVCRYARSGNCNVRKNVENDWYDKMLEDESACDPVCPPEGCF